MPVSFSRVSRSTSTTSPTLTPTAPSAWYELVERNLPLGLVADVDDHVVLGDLDHRALDDVAFFYVLMLERLFE